MEKVLGLFITVHCSLIAIRNFIYKTTFPKNRYILLCYTKVLNPKYKYYYVKKLYGINTWQLIKGYKEYSIL